MSSRLTSTSVTSIAETVPGELQISGSPVTTAGTLALSWANESANQILAGPTTGIAATPGFRGLVAADVPSLAASKITSGTLALAQGGTAADNSSVVANRVWAGPTTGAAASAGYRALVAADIPALSYGTGTVTSVGLSAPAELSVGSSPITTSGTLALTWANESANQVMAGPTSGLAATPGFRALVAGDIPNLDAGKITTGALALARGGTAVDNSSVTANRVWAGPTSGGAASASYRALVAADIPNLAASVITSGTLALAQGGTAADNSSVTANKVWAGPTTGAAASASYRSLVAADIPSPALTTASNYATGDTVMTTVDTYYDGATLSLSAGTWLLMGMVAIHMGASSCSVTVRLWDGTNVLSESELLFGSSSIWYSIPVYGIATPGTTTTYKVSAAGFNAANRPTIVATCGVVSESTTNKATYLLAVKVA